MIKNNEKQFVYVRYPNGAMIWVGEKIGRGKFYDIKQLLKE
jgi:hypothetical protein